MTAVPPTPTPRPAPSAAPAPNPKPNNLVGLALLAAFLASGYGLAQGAAPKLLTFVFVMLGWSLSVMAHEFCHAITAYAGGDWTVKAKGYLAFDPRRYGDLGTSLVLPLIFLALGGIGFPGGAVYLRTDLMRGPAWRAAAAFAGPFGTLIVLVVLALLLHAWPGDGGPLYAALAFLAFLQATALILNLLPFPGLDGFNIIRPFLPDPKAPWLKRAEGLAMAALFILLMLTPWAGALLFGAGAAVVTVLGVPGDAVSEGFRNFHFWR